MAGVTEALLDKRVKRSTVSRVPRRLGDEVEALRRAPITEPMAYLYLDATFVDARRAACSLSRHAFRLRDRRRGKPLPCDTPPNGSRSATGVEITSDVDVVPSCASWSISCFKCSVDVIAASIR